MKTKSMGFVVGVLVYALCGLSRADVRVPAVFGDHMVLQAGANTPVWGWAESGEIVTVTVGEAKVTTTAGADGKWKVAFTDLKTSAAPVTVSVAGKNTLAFQDVLIGDVWVCSGQSNMALPLRRVVGRDGNDPKGLGQANYPQIRLFKMPKDGFLEPQTDCRGNWSVCTPGEAREFSAVGYFFGREIHLAEHIPVGLINACRGSSNGEFWTSLEGLKSEAALSKYVDQILAAKADYPLRKERYLRDTDPWEDNVMALPTVLFNGMLAPLIPFGIKGAIWYQGEGNASEAVLYRTLLPAMIRDWRNRWGRGDFPFYFVQLANYGAPQEQPNDGGDWPPLREAQLMTLKSAANTAMAVAIDIGAVDIHPLNKQEVGRRLALAALAKTYGRRIEYSGPLYDRMEIKDGKIRIRFTQVGAGLVAKGGEPLKRFAIAGADKKFVWADARIDGATVVVNSTNVPNPMAVRYAWTSNPEGCNLYNAAGLPASPFRTDDWPLPLPVAQP